jgi:hypothetical protein
MVKSRDFGQPEPLSIDLPCPHSDFIFTYGLFNGAFNRSDFTALNYSTISEIINENYVEESGRGLI